MQITCWGSRGSIPVSGPEYLKYGGDTTCLELRTVAGRTLIVDAGTGIRRLGNRLVAEGEVDCDLIFTHAHWDHLMGFPFFKPIYHKSTRLNVYGCPFAQDSVKHVFASPMKPPHFPVKYSEIRAHIKYHGLCDRLVTLAGLEVQPILLSHPNQGIGYRFEENGKAFVFLTDNELTYRHPGGLRREEYCRFAAGADILFHDAEFTAAEYEHTRTWGHSIYLDALELALAAGVKRFGLFHHNQERADAGVDTMVADCRRVVAGRGAALDCFAVAAGTTLTL